MNIKMFKKLVVSALYVLLFVALSVFSQGQNARSSFVETAGGLNFKMIYVEGGTFTMGCTPEQGGDCDGDERPSHSVTLRDYYIGEYEVTQKLWKQVMGNSNDPSYFKGNARPVESVSWNDVMVFIDSLNRKTGRTYRLPTEAEWEYAARGGKNGSATKYSGSNTIDEVAWYLDNIPSQDEESKGFGTQPVGGKQPNELGIYDMSGNVWEWVSDWYGDYSNSAQTNPTGPATGSSRVFRGGSWRFVAGRARVSIRFTGYPTSGDYNIGFRLAVSP